MTAGSVLLYNIGELVTCAGMAQHSRLSGFTGSDLGRTSNAYLTCEDGKVTGYGPMPVPAAVWDQAKERNDAGAALVMPGLVDSHTHPLFAGARYDEFAMRLNGATYKEIAAKGGGIRASVNATRAASSKNLGNLLRERSHASLSHGITCLEVKSGYGLSVREELRHLEILRHSEAEVPQKLKLTCLALHAASPDYSSISAYVEAVRAQLLPELAASRLCDYVDAFVENGYFSVDDCEPYMQRARELGLKIRIHADEFSDTGAAAAAARWGAASADHLQFANAEGIAAMAKAGVVATVLPGTSLYTNIPFCNAKRFTKASCAVAIASDYNPGSCLIANLPMLASLAGLHCGLNVVEIVAGITFVAAHSLGLGKSKGALAEGYDADFLIHPAGKLEAYLADLGQNKPTSVWIAGRRAYQAAG